MALPLLPLRLVLLLLLLLAPTRATDLEGFEDIASRATPVAGLFLAPPLCFFGLAWYAHVALALGVAGGGALFALGAVLLAPSFSAAAIAFQLAAFAGGGTLGGAVLWSRPAICSFLVGGAFGASVAVVACCGIARLALENPAVPLAMTALFVIGGALFLQFERSAAAAWTSVLGAYWWLAGVGHFAGAFPTWRALADYAEGSGKGGHEAAWVAYLLLFVALAAYSFREQWRREQREGRGKGEGDKKDERMATPTAEADGQSTPFQRV